MEFNVYKNIKSISDIVFKQLTELGSITIILAIVVYSYFYNFDLSLRIFIDIIAITLIATIIKALFFHARPKKQKITTLVERIDASSFPSVHSARITALVFWLIYYSSNIILSMIIGVAGILVAYSRIYLKKHYWLDVFGGIVLGAIVIGATYYLM